MAPEKLGPVKAHFADAHDANFLKRHRCLPDLDIFPEGTKIIGRSRTLPL
jgi:hypothetical protein